MARTATPLTHARIRATQPAERPLKLADGGGMYLLVRPDGSRYWRLDYRFDGKRKTLALGVYPEVRLAEARRQRDAARALLAAGQDPAEVRRAGLLRDAADDPAAVLAALRESEERFRLLLDSSPAGIFGVDTEGICTFVNRACLDMLGYTREEMLGHVVHDLIHHTYPDGRPYPRSECRVRLASAAGEAVHVDNEVHWRKDGTGVPVEYRSQPLYRNGERVGAVVTFVDVSARKCIEAALRASEERYRLISSVSSDLLYSCLRAESGHFAIDWASSSVDRIFGHSLDDIRARGCWRCFVHPDDLPVFDRNITELVPGQRSECELRVLGPDGDVHYIRAYTLVVEEAASGRHRLYGACQDITERRRTQEALRESEARFRAMAEQSSDWIWSVDMNGRHVYSNARARSRRWATRSTSFCRPLRKDWYIRTICRSITPHWRRPLPAGAAGPTSRCAGGIATAATAFSNRTPRPCWTRRGNWSDSRAWIATSPNASRPRRASSTWRITTR